VNDVDWVPALAVLAAGLGLGAAVLWRVVLRGAARPASSPAVPALELRDLEGKYQACIAQLRELDEVGASKRTPEQLSREREELEHSAARALRDLEQLGPSSGAGVEDRAIESGTPAPASASAPSTLKGFLWGVGSVGALGLLFFLVSQSARERSPEQSVTGDAPPSAGARADDPEVARARAAVQRNPADVDARLELARLNLIRRDMMGVFEETQQVLQRSPGNPRALSYQALVRLAMGQADKAESMLKEALAADPQLLDAYIHLMLVHVRTGRAAEAEKVLADAARRFPDREESLRGLLADLKSQSDETQAAESQESAPDPHADVPVEGSGRRPEGAGKKVAGVLELDPSLGGERFAGAVVFVTLREGGFGAGPPLAARRIIAATFPIAFEIGSADSMTGADLPDELLVEARIDSDGDPVTRPPSDPYGQADRVAAGASGVKLVLKRRPAP
jgi:tetratricopeptide (TPR) repeat protein